MSLAPGTRLGPYEIAAKLGEGGMGAVWRATDTTLGREVALKLLPDDFADDPERHARFTREAKLLASLNHPNIAILHALEHLDGRHALVMELVEGEGLDEIIAHGPLSVAETLPIARQIAEALEAAHEAGIVHRDLKPANVRIRPDGTVKVLDFGLAKAWATGDGVELSHSPTITRAHTAAGVVLGTAAYMSPEQARGRPVDKRADIWAFGALLWEMLTGRRLFDGETVTDVLANVLKHEIGWSQLPDPTPAELRRLLRRCLARDPRNRLHDIADARITLEELLAGADREAPGAAADAAGSPRALWPALALTAVAALTLGAAAGWLLTGAHPPGAPSALSYIPPPPGTSFRSFGFDAGPVAVSPDGTRLAFSATDQNGETMIWVRRLNGGTATELAGTRDGAYPFWSADSRSLGFFADEKLKALSVDNGAVRVLADATCSQARGAWGPHGAILFVEQCGGPIMRIASGGGSPEPVVERPAGVRRVGMPSFLPGGDRFLYASATEDAVSVRRATLASGTSKLVLRDAVLPQYASGDLLFIRGDKVLAAAFDPSSGELRGAPTPLGEAQSFSVSTNGVLAFQGGTSNARLEWFDRSGSPLGTIAETARWLAPKISPDGSRLLAVLVSDAAGAGDLWSYPASGGVGTRLTFGPGWKGFSVWSPDGRDIAYSREAKGSAIVCRRRSDGSGAEETLRTLPSSATGAAVVDWSPDGRYLSVDIRSRENERFGNWVLPLDESRRPFRPAPVEANQYDGNFSPDGHWLAYFSYETGRPEVFVVPFPATGAKYQISHTGGWAVRWAAGGRLFFLSMRNRLMEADLKLGDGALRVSSITPLFQLDLPRTSAPLYDVTPDGNRFLVAASTDPAAASSITLLLNWPALVRSSS